jgi:hypothetical protein
LQAFQGDLIPGSRCCRGTSLWESSLPIRCRHSRFKSRRGIDETPLISKHPSTCTQPIFVHRILTIQELEISHNRLGRRHVISIGGRCGKLTSRYSIPLHSETYLFVETSRYEVSYECRVFEMKLINLISREVRRLVEASWGCRLNSNSGVVRAKFEIVPSMSSGDGISVIRCTTKEEILHCHEIRYMTR